MTTKTSHTGDPTTSSRLRLAVDILKDASGPMTVMELQDESRRRGGYLSNPGTCVYEIGASNGYTVSDGQQYGQKPGPAVRFPDGKYRYWLVSAPGWQQSWTVTKDFVVQGIGYRVQGTGLESEALFHEPITLNPEPCIIDPVSCPTRTCKACGKPIGDGPPFCDEVCKNSFLGIGKE